MILYHAVSSFQLLMVALIRRNYDSKEKGILFISQDVVRRLKNYKEFLYFFDDIWEYDNGCGNRMILSNGNVADYFNDIFKRKGYRIHDFNKIYLACAHHSFGIYIAEQNIPYIFIEDGVGALSRPEVLHKVEEKAKRKDQMSVEYGLYDGSGKYAISCIYNKNYQTEEFKHLDRYIHFDAYEELSQLHEKDRKYLLQIFTDLREIPCDEHSVLILTEHFANLRIFSWEEQILLYQLLVDYFFDGYGLVWKPHPDDLMYYKEYFPDSYLIKDKFPAEILPFLFLKKPKIIATVSSTAIYTLKSCFENTITFNYDFSHYKRQFKDLHRIYAALKIAESLCRERVYTYAVNPVIADNFIAVGRIAIKRAVNLKKLDEFIETPKGSVLIIDNCPYYSKDDEETICSFLATIPADKTVIFTNSEKDYCFYKYDKKELLSQIHPVKIEKKSHRSECYDLLKDESIYCFCKNDFCCPLISYTLQNTGISISVKEGASAELLIGILNGMNARLASCLKVNEEYRNQLTSFEKKQIPVFPIDFDALKAGYGEFDRLEDSKEQNFKIVKGMLMATERRYLYFLEENKYLEELIHKRFSQ